MGIFFAGKRLTDDLTIGDCKIQKGASFQFVYLDGGASTSKHADPIDVSSDDEDVDEDVRVLNEANNAEGGKGES